MPTDLCRYCGSTYDLIHGHACTPLTITTSTGGDHARREVELNATGSATTGSVAGPPDLDHAIHAARTLRNIVSASFRVPDSHLTEALNAVEAGAIALEQLQAMRDRAHALEVEVGDLQRRLAQADRNTFEARDRLADLEVCAAELADLLQRVYDTPADDGFGKALWLAQPLAAKVRAALAVDPPARGRATLDEVQRLRAALGRVLNLAQEDEGGDMIDPILDTVRIALDGKTPEQVDEERRQQRWAGTDFSGRPALDLPAAQEEDRCQNCGASLTKTTHVWLNLGSCELHPQGAAQEEDG